MPLRGWTDTVIDWVLRAAWRMHSKSAPSRGERRIANAYPGFGSGYGWPGGWSQDRREQVQHYRQWVYVGIRAIAQEVAGHTANVALVSEGEKDAGPKTRALTRKALGHFRPHEEVTPVRPDHPLLRLLRDPNGPDTAPEFWFELVLFWKLCGIAYVWAAGRNAFGLPTELWVIPSQWVWPVAGKDRLVERYDVRPYGGSGGKAALTLAPEEVLTFKDKSPLNKIDGWSPLTAGDEWIDAGESMSTAQRAHFKQGCFPGVHIGLPAGVDPDDTELDRIYAKLMERFGGEQNYHKPIVTTNGAELNRLTLTPGEMDYLQSGDQIRDKVLALLGVPKGVVGIEPDGNDLSAYAPYAQFCRFTVRPILRQTGATLTEKLGRRYGPGIRVWYDDPTPNDPVQTNLDIATDIKGQAITPNEIRALRGREPYDPKVFPEGDKPCGQVAENNPAVGEEGKKPPGGE